MEDLREYYYKSPGNPDKICELITERIIDDIHHNTTLNVKSNIHTIVKNQVSVVAGKIYCGEYRPNTDKIVQELCEELGYNNKNRRFSSEAVRHINLIEFLDEEKRFPSNNFIKSVGYASDETPEGLPIGHILAREITNNILKLDSIGFDVTTYLTVKYQDNYPKEITTINIEYSLNNVEEDPKELLHDCEVLFDGKCDNYMNLVTSNTQINISCLGLGGPDTQVGSLSGLLMPSSFGGIWLYDFFGKSHNDLKRMSSLVARAAAKTISKSSMCNEALIEVSYNNTQTEPASFTAKFNNIIGDVDFMTSNLQDIFNFNKDEINSNFDGASLLNNTTTKKEYFGHEYMGQDDKDIFPWEKLNKLKEFTPF